MSVPTESMGIETDFASSAPLTGMGAFGKRTRKDPYFEDRSKETAEEAEAGGDDDDDGARTSPEGQQ